MTKKPTKKLKAKAEASSSKAERLAATDVDQYNIEREFAAGHVVQGLLEAANGTFQFDVEEDEEGLGTCELYGAEDARDRDGRGGTWAIVRIYVPNIDIDAEINR